jgi:hypothetical protein
MSEQRYGLLHESALSGMACSVSIASLPCCACLQYAGGDKVAMAPLLGYDGQFDASSSSKVFRYWWVQDAAAEFWAHTHGLAADWHTALGLQLPSC